MSSLRGRAARVALVVGCLVLTAVAVPVGAGADGFPQSPPDDPGYASGAGCSSLGQYWLFSTIPSACALAHDPENAAGMSVESAWKDYTTGDPTTVLAYIEGGVNYRDAMARDLVNQMYLNQGELPYPETEGGAACGAYDCNHDGAVNIQDYAQDPRVKTPYVEGYLTPEDLIVAFGHCAISNHEVTSCSATDHVDNDGNGYPNDIAGWDFAHNTNDVQTDWSHYIHSDQQTSLMAAQTDNAVGGAGVCPHCQIMYIKDGDEAIAAPDLQAEAVLYAVDTHVSVIAEEAVGFGVSHFQLAANRYAWDHGVPMSLTSNDFDSTDHTDGMRYPHVLPGNSLATQGAEQPTSFRNHSSITSWGTHMMFSVPSAGGSSSEATPIQAGALALLVSYARQHGDPLSAGEVTQLMIAAASPVQDPSLQWPGKPGYDWNLNYGYGRPNVHKALSLIAAGKIPPVPDIVSPRWYKRYDPARHPKGAIAIDGTVTAHRAQGATFKVEYALGPEPGPSDWHALTSAVGPVHGSYTGRLATLPLSAIPASFYERRFRNTGARTSATSDRAPEQYAVTIRVTATDDRGLVGVDRRAVYVSHDGSELRSFPRDQGFTGGESPPVPADLQGNGRTDIVLANDDGTVHAYGPSGRELPGWPVRTRRDPNPAHYLAARAYKSVAAPRDPIGPPVAVGDLFGNGKLEVVATTDNGRLYVWDARGRLVHGFPHQVGHAPPYPVPSPAITGHSPVNQTFTGPVLAHLRNKRELDIVQPAFDGYVHALAPTGREVPGWPVHLKLPAAQLQAEQQKGETYFDDEAIVSTPAIADLAKAGHPQVILGSEESLYPGQSLFDVGGAGEYEVVGYRPMYAIYADGNRHAGGPFVGGWPVLVTDQLSNIGGGIDFVFNATESPSVGDFLGNGGLQVAAGTAWGPTQILNPSGSVATTLSNAGSGPGGPDTVYDFTSSGAPAKIDGKLDFFQPGSGETSFLRADTVHTPVYNYEQGWDPRTGQPLPGFPQVQQGLAFFGEPAIASVEASGAPDVLQATDSMTLHAFRADGSGEANGFPKFTGGWSNFAPAVADLTGDGHADVVLVTREGYLEAFRTPGLVKDAQWCGFQGGPERTGLFSGSCALPRGARVSCGASRSLHLRVGSTRVRITVRVGRRRVRGARVRLRVGGATRRARTNAHGRATFRVRVRKAARATVRTRTCGAKLRVSTRGA